MEEKTPLTIEDYYKFKFIASTAVSSDGSKIAYSLLTYHEVEKKDLDSGKFSKEERSNIWILDTKTKKMKQYTFGKTNFNPSWSPDGKKLAFISKRADENQIYVISVDGGEAQQVTYQPVGVSSVPVWSPDGTILAFSGSSLEKKVNKEKPYRYKRDFYRLDASGNVDNFRQDIFTINLTTKEVKQLTNDDRHHTNPRWSPDGSMLLWLTSFSTIGVDAFNPIFSVYKNGEITDYLVDWGYSDIAEWITNESIVFQGRPKERIIGAKDDIYTFDLNSNLMECRSHTCILGIGGRLSAFMPGGENRLNKLIVSGGKVLTNVQNKGTMAIYEFTLTGKEEYFETIGGERACYIQGLGNEKVFFLSSSLNKPIDIFSKDMSSSLEEQLTFANTEFLSAKQLPDTKKIDIPCIDGATTEGWFLLPQSKAPFPTLLKIHGGPHSALGNIFHWDAQLLAGSGYAVLMVNHRGSTGYGDAFATATNGDWGNLDFKDLMSGIDVGIEQGIINSEKMGCFGISGGGNLSCWIVGNTDRFKAAVPENPLTNWLSFYGVSDIGRWFAINEVGGLPQEIPEIYVKTSPITYAHNCKTPTLMIQHDNDLRCPPEQSEQFYAALKEAGCVVEMLRMPGTPHGGSIVGPLETREARSQALLDWFVKYVS